MASSGGGGAITTPNKNFNNNNNNNNNTNVRRLQEAIGKTSQQTRRFQVWLKHSVISKCNNPEPNFRPTTTTSTSTSTTTSTTKTQSSKDEQEQQRPTSNTIQEAPPTTNNTTPKATNNTYANAVVTNIDQALSAFSSYRQDFFVQEEHQDDKEGDEPPFDWILDGHYEWKLQYEKSRKLLYEMNYYDYYDDFEDEDDNHTKDDHSYEQEKRTKEWLHSLLLQTGSIGNQEYQFAAFDQDDNGNDKAEEEDGDDDEEEKENEPGNFADFSQLHQTTPQSEIDSSSSFGFGEFQQATTTRITTTTPVVGTSDVGSEEKQQHQQEEESITYSGKTGDVFDDDDFGDFQQAMAAATTKAIMDIEQEGEGEDNDDASDGFGAFQEATVAVVPVQMQRSPPTYDDRRPGEEEGNTTVATTMAPSNQEIQRTPALEQRGEVPSTRTTTTKTPTATGGNPLASREIERSPILVGPSAAATEMHSTTTPYGAPPSNVEMRRTPVEPAGMPSVTNTPEWVPPSNEEMRRTPLEHEEEGLIKRPPSHQKIQRTPVEQLATPLTHDTERSPMTVEPLQTEQEQSLPLKGEPLSSTDEHGSAKASSIPLESPSPGAISPMKSPQLTPAVSPPPTPLNAGVVDAPIIVAPAVGGVVDDRQPAHYASSQSSEQQEQQEHSQEELYRVRSYDTANTTEFLTHTGARRWEPKTPTATNVSRQNQHQQPHRWDDEEEIDDNEEEEESTTHADNQSTSVPSVVQLLFTSSIPDEDISSLVVPSTVRVESGFHTPVNKTQKEGGRPSLTRPLGLLSIQNDAYHDYFNQNYGEEPSITSSHHRTSDIRSPEGRFLRRHYSQMLEDEKLELGIQSMMDTDDDTDLESLGSYWKSFQMNNYQDNTLEVLKGLEWEWFPYWQLEHLLAPTKLEANIPLLHDQITTKLSELDGTHLKICKKLYRLIQPHAHELHLANSEALELSTNLQLCFLYLERSQESVEVAKFGLPATGTSGFKKSSATSETENKKGRGGGVEGAKDLLRLWDTRESYSTLSHLLAEMGEVYTIEKDLLHRIDNYDTRVLQEAALGECQSILNDICSLQGRLESPPLNTLQCMREMLERVSHMISGTFLSTLHSWLEATTVRCCHHSPSAAGFDSFSSDDYSRLVKSILLVREKTKERNLCETKQEFEDSFHSAFCTSIHTALLLEVQTSFGRALLDPTDSEHEESEYDKELMSLSNNFYSLDTDPSKLSTWLQNLVTIRFDFEIQKHPLPAVYHRLCWLLTNILYGQYQLLEWHAREAANENPFYGLIYTELLGRRTSVWNSCVKCMEECLEEYLKYVEKKKLFGVSKDNEHDDSEWMKDLEGLEDIVRLTDQFLSLRKEFLEGVSERFINDGGMLREKLSTLLKKHLRSFHVEAMNKMGSTLYQEEWVLVPLAEKTYPDARKVSSMGNTDDNRTRIQTILVDILTEHRLYRPNSKNRSKCNFFCSGAAEKHFARFRDTGNPFQTCKTERSMDQSAFVPTSPHDPKVGPIYDLLQLFCDNEDPFTSDMVPACLTSGVLKWVSRLIMLTRKLPPMADDACQVFSNIFDLYTTTVFRLCAGNAHNERILLGVDAPKANGAVEDSLKRGAPPPVFGFRRMSSSSFIAPTLPTCLEAELCSPTLNERERIQHLRDLILSAQSDLQGIVKLDNVDAWIVDPQVNESSESRGVYAQKLARVLEQRQAALWSCAFLAASLEITFGMVKQGMEISVGSTSCLFELSKYVDSFLQAAPVLVSLSNKVSCMRAIRGKAIVQKIISVGSTWEEAKLHENPNNYVEGVCDMNLLLWSCLCKAKNIPKGAIDVIWETSVAGVYMSLLDGFSRISYCSTEGRALMSMDLAAYASSCSPRALTERFKAGAIQVKPPELHLSRGMPYVDTYIKVFYFPSQDAFAWIEENFKDYLLNHSIALIVGAASSSEGENVSISGLVKGVKKLYDECETPKVVRC